MCATTGWEGGIEGWLILTQHNHYRRTNLGGMEPTTFFKVMEYMFVAPKASFAREEKKKTALSVLFYFVPHSLVLTKLVLKNHFLVLMGFVITYHTMIPKR